MARVPLMFLPRADAIAEATTGRCLAYGPDKDLKDARRAWEQHRLLMTRAPRLADALEEVKESVRTARFTDAELRLELELFFNRADIQALLLELK